jgi:hypothetical protein
MILQFVDLYNLLEQSGSNILKENSLPGVKREMEMGWMI